MMFLPVAFAIQNRHSTVEKSTENPQLHLDRRIVGH